MMEKYLTDKIDLFAKNRLLMQQGFLWEYPAVNGLVAILYTVYGKELDIDMIRSCRRVMRPSLMEHGFADGPGLIAASAMISLAHDPVEAFHYTIKVYNLFLSKGFKPSLYILLASINIAKHRPEPEHEATVQKAVDFYKYLESVNAIELYGENQTYKETLAATFSNTDVEQYTVNAQKCFQMVRPFLPNDNAAFVLTDTILVSDVNVDKNALYAVMINEKLKALGYEWKEDFQYAILGVLAMLGMDTDVNQYVQDILEVIDAIRANKILAGIHLAKDHELTYAGLLTEMALLERKPDVTEFYFDKVFVDMNIALIVNMVEEAHLMK